jgi:phytanoyl-CoA hydroxylase
MSHLSKTQKDGFWRDGVLVVEDAVTTGQLAELRAKFSDWVEESRTHQTDSGETLDGRPRSDLQPGHGADVPGLRRVQSPEEVSDVDVGTMRNAKTVDLCSELIGPAIRFHHGKSNSKLPGTATKVKWHQDFPFEPMTNDQ